MNIIELKIYSSNLVLQKEFYSKVIGLKINKSNECSVSFQLGKSILTIQDSKTSTPYHFAINIPSNKINEAYTWVKEKVEVLKDGDIEIQDFESWNAQAIYFYDQDKNIVELIARKNLNNTSSSSFGVSQFLEISEIGLVTTDVESAYHELHEMAKLRVYDGNMIRFCAIGDESGLFICINKNLKDWFPTNDKAFTSPFFIHFLEGDKAFFVDYKNGELESVNNTLN